MTPIRELSAALATAVVALAADASVLYALVGIAHWHYLVAASVAFMVGTLVSWALSVRYVFCYRRYQSPGREFLLFAVIGSVGLVLNAAVIAAVVEWLGLHYLVGKACAAVVTFSFNYGLRKVLLFTPVALAARTPLE